MPAYDLEFLSAGGPQRRRFTLDDDRPLRGQLEHVLAELDRASVVLQGGPADELVVYWNGTALDPSRTPAALGVTPDRPLQLRMQRPRPQVALPPPVPEAAPDDFMPKGVHAGAALGVAGGALAWGLAALLSDGVGPLRSPESVDAAAGLAWAGLVGALVGWGHRRRTDGGAAAGAARGLLAGLVAGVAWGALRLTVPEQTGSAGAAAWRVGSWLLLAAVVAAALALAVRADRGASGALGRAAGWAAVAGALAGAIGALPGEPMLWQALAFVVAGAGVGGAVAWGLTHAAAALVELEARDERPVGVASLREWVLLDGRPVQLREGGDATVTLVLDGTRCRLYADPAGRSSRLLRHDERIVVGRSRYRFRRRVVA
jgi:hypothetical protein